MGKSSAARGRITFPPYLHGEPEPPVGNYTDQADLSLTRNGSHCYGEGNRRRKYRRWRGEQGSGSHMRCIIRDRVNDGAAQHIESVLFGVVGLQNPKGSPMSSWSAVALDFSMQSAITAIGFGSVIMLPSDPAVARIGTAMEVRIAHR
jgi:hypothetical protein